MGSSPYAIVASAAQGSGLSNSDQHSHIDLPLVLVGGGAGTVKGGRHLRFPKDTPMNNLHMAMLEKVGVPVERFGDAPGRVVNRMLSPSLERTATWGSSAG